MKEYYTIGIDIGGTNSDAVLVDARAKIIAAAKSGTTPDIVTGFSSVLRILLEKGGVPVSAVRALFWGRPMLPMPFCKEGICIKWA